MRAIRPNSIRALVIVTGCSLGIAGIVYRQLTEGKGRGNGPNRSIVCTVIRPDGQPAAGVWVTAFALAPGQSSRSAVTNGKGECRFDSADELPRANFENLPSAVPLFAQAAGTAPAIGIASWSDGPGSARVSMKLRRPDTVTFKILSDHGAPIPRLPVRLTAIASGNTYVPLGNMISSKWSGETNNRGEMRLERLPHGGHVILSTDDPKFTPSSPEDAIALEGDGEYVKTVRIHDAGQLMGELRHGADGRPAAGVSVVLTKRDSPRPISTTTDAHGAYAFPRLAAGTYDLNANIRERGWYAETITCHIEAGRTRQVRMVTRKMGLVTITVHDRGGLPVPGVIVDNVATNAAGVAQTYAKPGRHVIAVNATLIMGNKQPRQLGSPGSASLGGFPSASGTASLYNDVAPPLAASGSAVMVREGEKCDAAMVVDVPESENVHGLVTDASGHPVAGALVHSAPLAVYQNGISISNEWARFDSDAGSTADGQCPWVAVTDSEGRFRISRVSNICTLWASRGPTDASPTRDRTVPGQNCILEVRKSVLGAIAGKVVSADGRAIPDARVQILRHYAHSAPFESGPLTRTDRNGRFQIDSLPCGLNYSLRVCSETHGCVEFPGPTSAAIVLHPGELRTLPAIIAPATPRSIGGTVKDGNGYPVASASVIGTGSVTGTRHAVTDREGRFKMPHVAAEPIRLRATLSAPKLPQPDPSRYIERSHIARAVPRPNSGFAARYRQLERMGPANRAGDSDEGVNTEVAEVAQGMIVTGQDAPAAGMAAPQPVIAMGGSANVEVPLSPA